MPGRLVSNRLERNVEIPLSPEFSSRTPTIHGLWETAWYRQGTSHVTLSQAVHYEDPRRTPLEQTRYRSAAVQRNSDSTMLSVEPLSVTTTKPS